MSLKDKIETNYKNSLKSKDKAAISTYRLILSSIKDLDIANRSGPNKKETDDEDIKKLLKKMIKQRDESIDIYKKNNRQDLLEVEQKEHEILSSFLPKQLSEEETKNICNEMVKKLNATSIKDMGKVMGVLKKEYSDNLDFSKAGSYLKRNTQQIMKYPKEYLDEIKTRLKVSTVVSKSVNLKKRGKEFVGSFPIQNRKNTFFYSKR